jgi:hypothetical protein
MDRNTDIVNSVLANCGHSYTMTLRSAQHVSPPHAGGGYALGACNQQLNTVAATAAAANLTIICPDYGLAPEHPFPAGLNDALSVYKVGTLNLTEQLVIVCDAAVRMPHWQTAATIRHHEAIKHSLHTLYAACIIQASKAMSCRS